jgi:hypothetical protein
MQSFNAYIYDDYAAAQAAVQQCDDFYGFAIECTHTTADILPYGEKYYIIADTMTIPVLGENYELINIQNENNL